MGDFNIDFLKYDTNNDSAPFLDMMYEDFLPYIFSPTRVTPRSQTLIDNIFSNIIEDEIISGNIKPPFQTTMHSLHSSKTKQNHKKIKRLPSLPETIKHLIKKCLILI